MSASRDAKRERAKQVLERAKANRKLLEDVYKQPLPRTSASDWWTFEGIDPLCTENQKNMEWYYEQFGDYGLAHIIHKISLYEAGKEHGRKKEQLAEEGCEEEQEEKKNQATRDAISYEEDQGASALGSDFNDTMSNFDITNTQEQSNDAEQGDKDDEPTSVSIVSPPPCSEDENKLEYAHESWKLILDDFEKEDGLKTLFYLSSLPPELKLALIRGDLPSKMRDPDFRHKFYALTDPEDCQGTYVVYISVNMQAPEKNQDPRNIGKGLTLRQLLKVIEGVRLYIDVQHVDSAAYAQKVDVKFSGQPELRAKLDYKYQRRYGSGNQNDVFEHQQEWLHHMELYYERWIDNHKSTGGDDELLDFHLERCFSYVGQGRNNLWKSLQQHHHWGGISPVFGLVCAILRLEYDREFTTQNSTYQVFSTVHKSHIDFDEKLTTLLCSAYPWDGGLSTAYAGVPLDKLETSDAQHQATLDASLRRIKESGRCKANLAESRKLVEGFKDQLGEALQHETKYRQAMSE